MPTTKEMISGWFDRGVEQGDDYMIIVCDTFDYGDYPVYCEEKHFYRNYSEHNGNNMQRIMEVYDLHKDKQKQLNTHMNYSMPPAHAWLAPNCERPIKTEKTKKKVKRKTHRKVRDRGLLDCHLRKIVNKRYHNGGNPLTNPDKWIFTLECGHKVVSRELKKGIDQKACRCPDCPKKKKKN